jgi:hypothetical protein
MIGVKTLAVVALSAAAIAAAWARGLLDPRYLDSLSAATCIAVGSLAALATALIAVGWRPDERSRVAVDARGRLVRVAGGKAIELPAAAQHALFAAAAGCVALGALSNQATERLTALPAALAAPSSTGCPQEVEESPPVPAAPAPEIPGCALIRRAFQLGYTKSLGSCAPKTVAAAAPRRPSAPCTLRQADEPALHFTWRRMVDQVGSLPEMDPVAAVAESVADLGIKIDHLDALAAHQGHAVAAHPRASHHLWINLPAPRRVSWLRSLVDPVRCADRAEHVPLWRGWSDQPQPASALVDDVVAQLLFSPGFGPPPAQCGDLAIHWDAPADACRRLAADPVDFLDQTGALEPVRQVLDRRRRVIQLGELDRALGRRSTVDTPAEVRALVSLSCFVVDPAAARSGAIDGRELRIDGDAVPMRELRVPAVRVAGAGPLEVYEQVARLLAGAGGTGSAESAAIGRLAAPPAVADVDAPDYLLARLDHLRDADPFLGVRWPLERPDLIEVYPFRRHLHHFVDGFRRLYRAQRAMR